MSSKPAVAAEAIERGLAGVVFDETRITDIQGRKGELRYRGYAIEELAAEPSFEKVAYLLLHGEWPTGAQHRAFEADLAARRCLSGDVVRLLDHLAGAHPDDALRTAVSSLDLGQHRGREPMEIGLDLVAKIPSLIVSHAAIRAGRRTRDPDPALDHASDFLRRLLERTPSAIDRRAINLDFVLHADHGANASAFAGRVVAGTGADMIAAVTGAMAAFVGPLHGGAVAAADAMLAALTDPSEVPAFLRERRRQGLPIYGFGHRVYRTRDPRSEPYRRAMVALASRAGDDRAVAVLEALIDAMAPFRRMGIDVNVDLYVTVLYRLLGLPRELATSAFVAGRIVGWVAQILEQQANNILIRPRLRYAGPSARPLPPEPAA